MQKQISIYHRCYLPLSQTFIHRQLQGLQRFFNLRLFCHETDNRSEFPGFEPVLIPEGNLSNRLLGRYRRAILKELSGSALFHVNFGHFAVSMQPYARRAGIPMTAYFLGADASMYLRDSGYCSRLRNAEFDAVFVNSQDMKLRLTPYLRPGTECTVLYCGIPLELFPFRERSSLGNGGRFLQVSRLDPKKGVDVTLKAFRRYVEESDPTARLVIAGDGPLRDDLMQLSQSLGVAEKVTFAGAVGYRDYQKLLQAADVFIHPSQTAPDGDMEGLPTAICEAMACGLPILSTRHSGIGEVVDDGENGFLVDEGDDSGLFERMVLLRSCDVAAMSGRARQKIELRFDHVTNTSVLAGNLNRIIKGGSVGQ